MSTDYAENKITMKAAADYSAAANKYKFIYVSADNTATVCAATGAQAIGVLYNNPTAAGEEAIIALGPVVKIQADAAVAVDALVGTSADGQAVTKSAADDLVFGIALTAASAAGEIIEVIRHPLRIHA